MQRSSETERGHCECECEEVLPAPEEVEEDDTTGTRTGTTRTGTTRTGTTRTGTTRLEPLELVLQELEPLELVPHDQQPGVLEGAQKGPLDDVGEGPLADQGAVPDRGLLVPQEQQLEEVRLSSHSPVQPDSARVVKSSTQGPVSATIN